MSIQILTNNTDRIKRDFMDNLVDTARDTARQAESVARANCPVNDGEYADMRPEGQPHLVETITSEVVRTDDGVEVVVRAGDPDRGVSHADLVERGTGVHREGGGGRQTPWVYTPDGEHFFTTQGSEAQPFMSPAYEAAKPGFEDGCRKAIG